MKALALIAMAAELACTPVGSALSQQPVPATPPGNQPSNAPAQGLTTEAKKDTADIQAARAELIGYYAVPEIPASTILGVTASDVTRPVTPKDFSSSLLSAIDPSGKVKQGFAIEGTLGLFPLFRVPLATYQSDWRTRLLSNLAFSIASTQTSGDTTSTDLGWGIRAPLYDEGDALADTAVTNQLYRVLSSCLPTTGPVDIPRAENAPTAADSTARADAAAKRLACLDKATKLSNTAEDEARQAANAKWNVKRAILGYAGSARLAQSSISNRQVLGHRAWLAASTPLSLLTGAMPFGDAVQVIGYLDYWRKRTVDTVAAHSTFAYGGRVNIGSARVNGFYELLGEQLSGQPKTVSRSRSSWSGGIEFLASKGVWISTGFGKRAQDLLKPSKTVVLANIRWGIAEKSYLTPQ